MRPRKTILLVGDDELRVSLLGFLLRTYAYGVFTADCAPAAEQLMLLQPAGKPFELLLVVWPLEGAATLLKRSKAIAPDTSTLFLAQDEGLVPSDWTADGTIFRYEYSGEVLLERVRVLTARRRGPRPRLKVMPEMNADAAVTGSISK